ncbi:hypothetical protein HPB48_003706 [Haemaphysalis longicornis]|uniref:DDE-1 domain-containing protein n=1 Tax=Haemaphysalis longicornis TaxID=44386 RepID=A0A9J6FFY3_HAELO|nr:hypothetical protein HPB48_003706 [Haemaphysalis longicornis]
MDQCVIENLKLHYRSRLLNRVLLCVDSDTSYVVDVLSAVSILSDAWKVVTQDTIRNCFQHAGFVVGSEDEENDTVQNPTAEMPPAAASDIFDELRASGVNVGVATFEDFTNIDSVALPCAERDDVKIVRQVHEPAQVVSDYDDDVPPMLEASNTDLARALTVLLSDNSNGQTLAEIQVDLVALGGRVYRRSYVRFSSRWANEAFFFFSESFFFGLPLIPTYRRFPSSSKKRSATVVVLFLSSNIFRKVA